MNTTPTISTTLTARNTHSAKPLARYGLSAEKCAAVDYDFFRQAVAGIASPQLKTYRGNTFIFDASKQRCALIKPPYFDAQGRCQPIRYFWLEGIQHTGPALRAYQQWSSFDIKVALHNRLLMGQKLFKAGTQLLQQFSQQFLPERSQQWVQALTGKPAPVKRRGVTVWTTLRLTA